MAEHAAVGSMRVPTDDRDSPSSSLSSSASVPPVNQHEEEEDEALLAQFEDRGYIADLPDGVADDDGHDDGDADENDDDSATSTGEQTTQCASGDGMEVCVSSAVGRERLPHVLLCASPPTQGQQRCESTGAVALAGPLLLVQVPRQDAEAATATATERTAVAVVEAEEGMSAAVHCSHTPQLQQQQQQATASEDEEEDNNLLDHLMNRVLLECRNDAATAMDGRVLPPSQFR